ncbi:MAG TPA: hypothetical protein VJ719_04805 [Chthoniobacterales bacterium]|nr:hypothetical protein [Chthoniobacterales bacterium]
MIKIIAVAAVGMFAVGSAFAGDKGECLHQAGNKDKDMAACHVSFASLDLTADQKTKLEAAKADHEKEGCTEASEAKYMKAAKSILNKDQYAKFKAEAHGKKDKTQS